MHARSYLFPSMQVCIATQSNVSAVLSEQHAPIQLNPETEQVRSDKDIESEVVRSVYLCGSIDHHLVGTA